MEGHNQKRSFETVFQSCSTGNLAIFIQRRHSPLLQVMAWSYPRAIRKRLFVLTSFYGYGFRLDLNIQTRRRDSVSHSLLLMGCWWLSRNPRLKVWLGIPPEDGGWLVQIGRGDCQVLVNTRQGCVASQHIASYPTLRTGSKVSCSRPACGCFDFASSGSGTTGAFQPNGFQDTSAAKRRRDVSMTAGYMKRSEVLRCVQQGMKLRLTISCKSQRCHNKLS